MQKIFHNKYILNTSFEQKNATVPNKGFKYLGSWSCSLLHLKQITIHISQEPIVNFPWFASKLTREQNIARHTWIGRSHKLVTFSLIVLLWALSKMPPLTEGIMAPGEFLSPLKITSENYIRLPDIFGG